MNIFSKIATGNYIRYLLCFTVFFSCNQVFSENKTETPSTVEKLFQESNNEQSSTDSKNKNNETGSSESKDNKSAEKSEEQKDIISGIMKTISNQNVSKPFEQDRGYFKNPEEIKLMNLSVTNITNKTPVTFSLKELKGSVVIVFFTMVHCPNCEPVFLALNDLADKLSSEKISNVKIVTLVVGDENENEVGFYYKSRNVQLLDQFKSISPSDFVKQFPNINGFPTCIIVNKNGESVWGFMGANNYGSPDFLKFVESLSEENIGENNK